MKKIFLLGLSCFAVAAVYSQNISKEEVKKYTVSGGVLGAFNWSKFDTKNTNPADVEYNYKTGFAAGAWVNFPIVKAFSIEPQVMYSSYSYHTDNNATSLILNDGKIRYISVPLLLKLHAGDQFAFILGPQVDFLSSLKDNNTGTEDDFKKTSFSVFGGVEVFPHGRVTVFGRYIHGLSNMSDLNAETGSPKYQNQNIQAGLKIRLFGNKPKATYQATTTAVILDADGDGLNDDVDKCPNEAGPASNNGCPVKDRDGDGVNDDVDKCPDVAGLAKYEGCPIPDTDKDGLNDEEDKCPNEAGPASNNGCPVKDRDGDGVNDDVDKCPDVAGPASNNGCPEIPKVSAEVNKMVSSTGNISFSAGSTKLSAKSTASLSNIIKIMKDDPGLKLKLKGYTDDTEKDDNMQISEGRANAVKAYLVSKGISEDRITVEGFGSTTPIGDNTTAGRTKNRRVELEVTY